MKKRGRAISPPKYGRHATGQAVVVIHGKFYYLGKYGSDESHRKYNQLLAEKWSPPTAPMKPKKTLATNVTVSQLAIEYGKQAINKHGRESFEWGQIQSVLKYIRATWGGLRASDFGPMLFETYRQKLVGDGYARSTVTRKANYVLKMYQTGVKFELIPVELWQRLLAVGPVEMPHKPSKKRGAVPMEIVKATQAELTPVLSDMVEVHRLIGARPTEVCNMRPCDIDRSGDVWVYEPPSHKTEHHGHSRRIVIGPKAQEILTRYLLRDSQAFCFTPSEAFEQHCTRRHEQRTTPMNEGNKPKRKKKKKSFRPNYNKDTYRRAIERAAKRAFPVPEEIKDDPNAVAAWNEAHIWKPNQLRKSAATTARKEMDLETAQYLLGHSSKKTTEKFYADIDDDRAIEFARKHG